MKLNQDILTLEKSLLKLENLHASFDYLKINIASPTRIQNWAHRRMLPNGALVGEVLTAETINFRTYEPQMFGLFCQRIFGPIKNWKCRCGQYNGFILDKVCEECYVELIEARVRRYRMGFIELTCPIAHLWYFKGVPNYLFLLLSCFSEELTPSHIEEIIYLQKEEEQYLFIDSEEKNPLLEFLLVKPGSSMSNEFYPFLTEGRVSGKIYRPEVEARIQKRNPPKRRWGSEIIKAALEALDLEKEIKKARTFLDPLILKNLNFSLLPEKSLIRRIRILESFFSNQINPSWLILTVLPVLPPNLRPLVELENGRLVAADVNEIYRLVLTRNQRLFDFLYQGDPIEIVTFHARKLLQEAVDSLIDNSRLPKERIFSLNNKALKSLTEILEGKQGRFRQSLLGKRVDYSGRSVIIVGPNLRLNQCGLPYEMALELFQPFLINELLKTKIKAPSHNTKLANTILKKNKPFVWILLAKFLSKQTILLNRAPTLHKFGIQAFDPLLILGQAIHLHPLVCTGFNADFDGDQMAIHIPLYESSQLEARTLMRPSSNFLSPSNGEVILKPTQDMVIGLYYLTLMIYKNPFVLKRIYSSEKEAFDSFSQKKIEIHSPILIRYQSSSFELKIEKQKLFFFDSLTKFQINQKEISLLKIFPCFFSNEKKLFLITNIGIFLVQETEKKTFHVSYFFLETTIGRLLFSNNLKNSLKLSLKNL